MKILGLCGSLRDDSANAKLLALAREELYGHDWSTFDIGTLPFFDPDRQFAPEQTGAVASLRALGAGADRIFLTTPEYAHGIPGVLKNALEWLFHEGTQKKPVWFVVGSGQGKNTRDQLIEVLRTMDFGTGPEQALLLRGVRALLGPDGRFRNGEAEMHFRGFCEAMVR